MSLPCLTLLVFTSLAATPTNPSKTTDAATNRHVRRLGFVTFTTRGSSVLSLPVDRGQQTDSRGAKVLDESRRVRAVSQRVAKLPHGAIDGVIEIDEGVVWPKVLLYLLASDDLTGVPEQEQQDLPRLVLKLDSDPKLAQFPGAGIQFQTIQTDTAARPGLTAACLKVYHRHSAGPAQLRAQMA